MNIHALPWFLVCCATLGWLGFGNVLGDEPNGSSAVANEDAGEQSPDGKTDGKTDEDGREGPVVPRMPVAAARVRATLMHDIYTATLEVMHDRYFHGPRATVPARAMQDVFAEIKRQSHTEAKWISASLKPMSIDHEPKTRFEKQAAKQISSGKPEVEAVEDGYYRRATAIPLHGGCISCHEGFFPSSSTTAKFAGLVISIPVLDPSDDGGQATPSSPTP